MLIQVRIDVSGAVMDFRRMQVRTRTAADTLVTRAGVDLQSAVRARASGRPGPRAQTGAYRRGISVGQLQHPAPGTSQIEVFTNSPQGRRLEFGFMNRRDSLGRLFKQPARPHWRPAVEDAEKALLDDAERVLDRITGSTP